MIQTIRVASQHATDPYGQDVLAEVHRTLGLAGLQRVRTAKVYRLEGATAAEAAQDCSPNPRPDYAVSVDHEAKPALTAYRVTGDHLVGYAYDSQLGTALTGSANIEAHRFERAGQYRIVAFTDTGERIGRQSPPPLSRLMGFSAAVFPDWTGRLAIADYPGNTSYVDGSSVWVTLTQAPQYIYPVPLTAAHRADGPGLRLPRVTLPW